jgi:hypothetical protein
MTITKEDLKSFLPGLSPKEINFIISYFNEQGIDLDKIDFYACGNDTNYEILQGYLFQQYGIELPDCEKPLLFNPNDVIDTKSKQIYHNNINVKKLLNKPKIIGIVADINQGKSMLLYHIIETAKKDYSFNLYYYGLRLNVKGINAQRVYSVAELESVRNALIVIDELSSLFDLENRKSKRLIENSLRLLNHNNNILILCGTPENFKKFISAKVNEIIFKKCTISDFINGSSIKNTLLSYKGYELGSEMLGLDIDKAIHYDANHYSIIDVPYYDKYDSKKDNMRILQQKPKIKIY